MPSQSLLHLHEIANFKRQDLEIAVQNLARSAYLGDYTAIVRILGRYKFYIDTRDRGFGSHLLLDGYWEIWLTQFCARNIQAGMVVVDVGANFGYYSVLLAELVGATGKLIAVEPNPHAMDFLKRSIDLNGFLRRTHFEQSILSDETTGTAPLFVPHHEPKNATVVEPHFVANPLIGSIIDVPVTTVDQLCKSYDRVDFIKIDAEGAEQRIFGAMEETIARHKPMIVVEFNVERYTNGEEFIRRLTAVYGTLRRLDFKGKAHIVSPQELLTKNVGEDWLLVVSAQEPA
ncbi:FkbM family methyltransferase [Phyllobacterium sp. OV277]|jgi:FkbM family methyltransferase|uniref:FkbM family methyltransferase n=1 Tax=Phyllobacterium sp. OV277 TaxID=1882772 RepID=UPI00088D7E72|nr:FkbM family methyltransferase [Phyllobacterium sp. OV277]SDP50031.1 methyltransferase, FkbM family [Phyllobacterium sp. OV277]